MEMVHRSEPPAGKVVSKREQRIFTAEEKARLAYVPMWSGACAPALDRLRVFRVVSIGVGSEPAHVPAFRVQETLRRRGHHFHHPPVRRVQLIQHLFQG